MTCIMMQLTAHCRHSHTHTHMRNASDNSVSQCRRRATMATTRRVAWRAVLRRKHNISSFPSDAQAAPHQYITIITRIIARLRCPTTSSLLAPQHSAQPRRANCVRCDGQCSDVIVIQYFFFSKVILISAYSSATNSGESGVW